LSLSALLDALLGTPLSTLPSNKKETCLSVAANTASYFS